MSGFFSLIILGIVQGLTEFLPVSSSGHLVLLSKIFGISDSLFVSIILHVATLLSVVVALRKEVFQIVRHPFSKTSLSLAIATIPTCLIVLIFYPLLTESFEGAILPLCFFASGIILILTDFFIRKKAVTFSNEITFKQALVMGTVQGLATLPGISRSGSTICAGILAKGESQKVAKFSFLMSIPIIILSMGLEIVKLILTPTPPTVSIPGIICAFLLSFAVGLIAIKWMINLTQKVKFKWFGIYLILLAILTMFV